MHPQRSLVIQGSFPAGGPRVVQPAGRPGQPARPVAQPAGSSHVTQLDPTRLNLGGAGGSALPEPVQRKMETFFKTDFSDVRVHVGPQASSIGALAFTLGSNIYFAPGQYNPQSVHGQQLLGHELAHVLQQRAGRVRNPQGSGVAVVQDPHLEAEADRLGRQAAAQPMMPMGGLGTQRPGSGQAKPAASLPGARPVAPHVQAALAAVGQPQRPGLVQAKPAVSLPGTRPVAAHVQVALAAVGQPQRPGMVQAKPAASLPGVRPVAPHVQAALAAVGQPKVPTTHWDGQQLAPHVQAAAAAGVQPRMPRARSGGRPVEQHVPSDVVAPRPAAVFLAMPSPHRHRSPGMTGTQQQSPQTATQSMPPVWGRGRPAMQMRDGGPVAGWRGHRKGAETAPLTRPAPIPGAVRPMTAPARHGRGLHGLGRAVHGTPTIQCRPGEPINGIRADSNYPNLQLTDRDEVNDWGTKSFGTQTGAILYWDADIDPQRYWADAQCSVPANMAPYHAAIISDRYYCYKYSALIDLAECKFQGRGGNLDEKRLQSLCEAIDNSVTLEAVQLQRTATNNVYQVTQGNHRIEASRCKSKTKIPVEWV